MPDNSLPTSAKNWPENSGEAEGNKPGRQSAALAARDASAHFVFKFLQDVKYESGQHAGRGVAILTDAGHDLLFTGRAPQGASPPSK